MNKTRIAYSITFPPPLKSCRLLDVEKFCRNWHTTDDNVIRCMSTACWIIKTTEAHSKSLYFYMAQEIPARLVLPIIKASRSHSDTPHSIRLLWTSYHPNAGTSTWQHILPQVTDIHAPGGIRIYNPSKRAATYLSLRRRDHWTRPEYVIIIDFPLR